MLRVLSLFSGIGAFETALRRGGYQFEIANYCEIDPYASKAYSQIHDIPEGKNLHDVREINPLLLDNINLVTYGFPCQDISVAGKQKGFEYNGERTRSGLFFEALRIIEFLQPEYAICENVKALTSKKFEKEFNTVLSSLAEVGYNNYWKVLNAKDYGIPQNRERVFIISIRKDIDTGAFTFPEKQELKLRVKDLLEEEVESKYYMYNTSTTELIKQIISKATIDNREVVDATIFEPNVKDVSNCITARYDAGIQTQKSIGLAVIEKVGRLHEHQRGAVFSDLGISPCLSATDYKEPRSVLQTSQNIKDYVIRKLTPKECFRLMGFSDSDFDKIKGISNTQLYKMAGNSIVVNVLEEIFRELFKAQSR